MQIQRRPPPLLILAKYAMLLRQGGEKGLGQMRGGALGRWGEGSLARYAIVCICRLCLRVNQATITIAAAHAEENLDQPRPLIMVYLTHCIMSGHLVTHPGYAKQTRSLGIRWNLW